MSALGFGHDCQSTKLLLQTNLEKDTHSLTSGWVQYFLQKHPEISRRRSKALGRLQARAFSQGLLEYYSLNLEIAMFKCEEMSQGVSLTANKGNAKSSYVLAQKGVKQVHCIVSDSREHLTLVAHASASGYSGSPIFILPRKIPVFLGQHFPGSKVLNSSSGYMNDHLFIEWCHHFTEDTREVRGDPNLWCLLVLDSHHSHTMVPRALQILNENRILALSLPSHTSPFLQVHDVAIFAPQKVL